MKSSQWCWNVSLGSLNDLNNACDTLAEKSLMRLVTTPRPALRTLKIPCTTPSGMVCGNWWQICMPAKLTSSEAMVERHPQRIVAKLSRIAPFWHLNHVWAHTRWWCMTHQVENAEHCYYCCPLASNSDSVVSQSAPSKELLLRLREGKEKNSCHD